MSFVLKIGGSPDIAIVHDGFARREFNSFVVARLCNRGWRLNAQTVALVVGTAVAAGASDAECVAVAEGLVFMYWDRAGVPATIAA
jgi:hypothetical protein